jgi:DNA ligase (NAD+)
MIVRFPIFLRRKSYLVALCLFAILARASLAGEAPPVSRLTSDAARARLDELRKEVAHHDKLYFEEADPEISDYEYDELKRELIELEQTLSDSKAPSGETLDVGDDRTAGFSTYRHRERMLSLDKTYSERDLRDFDARLRKTLAVGDGVTYVVEPKFDGLAVSVTYVKGKLVRAATRGNGIEGDDITANALTISNLPRVLHEVNSVGGEQAPLPDVVELRGEIFMSWKEFRRINRERGAAGEPLFANPRNLAAGTIKELDARDVAQRKLEIVFYGWGAFEPATARPASQQQFHRWVRAWGLPFVEKTWTARGIDEVWSAVKTEGEARSTFAFPTDGAVVKLDAVAPREELGATNHAPRWAIAYKFAPERVETKVLGITVQVGRTGILTPVAELTPMQLAGSWVTRATLHNRDEIARRDIRVGDFVYVEKAGEIIPAVVGVNTARRTPESRRYVFPATCPACGAEVERLDGEVAERCSNENCPMQLRRRLEHYAAKWCVDIEGLGPVMIGRLVEKGWVKDIPDIYRLKRGDLLGLGKNVEKSTDRLLTAIERSKRVELWRFLYGLGIPQVGVVSAKKIAHSCGDLKTLMQRCAKAGEGQGDDFSGAGVSKAAVLALRSYFSDPKNHARIDEFVRLEVEPVERG